MAASISASKSRPAARSCAWPGTMVWKRHATSGSFSENQRAANRQSFQRQTSHMNPSASNRSSSRSTLSSSGRSSRVIRANSSKPVSLRLNEHGRSACRRMTLRRNSSCGELGVTPRFDHGRQGIDHGLCPRSLQGFSWQAERDYHSYLSNNVMNEIAIGIVSGLLATFLWWFGSKIFSLMILPWYRSQRYEGIVIAGEWLGRYRGYADPHECAIVLEQTATDIKGTITELVGADKGKIYSIEGRFKDLILTVSYAETNQSRIDRGTISLLLKENGMALEGYTIFYSDEGHQMKTLGYRWRKKDPSGAYVDELEDVVPFEQPAATGDSSGGVIEHAE